MDGESEATKCLPEGMGPGFFLPLFMHGDAAYDGDAACCGDCIL